MCYNAEGVPRKKRGSRRFAPLVSPFDSREYRRSRNAYTAQCAFEYFVSILVSDAFLAKLLKHIGMDDAAVGIVASLVSFSFLFQLFSVLLMQRVKNVKRTVLIADTVSQTLFLGVYLTPFLPLPPAGKAAAAGAGMLLGYAFKYAVSSILFRWANSYVDPKKRGEFSAVKEMISLISGILFTLAAGFVFDRFEADGDLRSGFLVLAAAIFALNLCCLVCLLLIRRETGEGNEGRRPLGQVLGAILGNRAFLRIVVLTCIWNAAQYMSVGFLGTYKTEELAFSVGTAQVVNMAANLCRFAVSKPFGRISDRTSYAHGFGLALLIAAAGFAAGAFTSPSSRWLIALYTALYYVSMAGSNQNSFNMTYSYVEPEYLVQAMAVRSSVGGIAGFAASIAGSRILSVVQAAGNRIGGVEIYGQQILCALSLLLTLAAFVYTKAVVEKQKVVRR